MHCQHTNTDPKSARRSALERFKNKIRRKHSENSNSNDGDDSTSESDSDFMNEDTSNLETASTSPRKPKSARKFMDTDDDGFALKEFYRNTLGLDVQSSSESEDEKENRMSQDMMTEPPQKRRRVDDERFEAMQEQHEEHSFGGLPISEDLMHKIAIYLDLTEISQILVLINHEFCGYFNTDKFWKKFYSMMSKTVMNQNEIEIVKSYRWDYNQKLYKRRILWYYCYHHARLGYIVPVNGVSELSIAIVQHSPFDTALKLYIPPLKYVVDTSNGFIMQKHWLHVDRKFMIKVHLVRECAVMHRQKMEKRTEPGNSEESQADGIDELYLVRSDEMNIILPRKRFHRGHQSGVSGSLSDQFVAYLMPKYRDVTTKVHVEFISPWSSPTDIFNTFRTLNQFFIEQRLNAMLKENLKDLQFMSRLQAFYERSRGNSSGFIKEFCGDDGLGDWDDVHDIDCNRITLSIESPKCIMHEQIQYVMQFINQYDDEGRLCCPWHVLKKEMREREILVKEVEFENLRTLVDERRFTIKDEMIISVSE